jgi:hypothetical protein
MWRPIDKEQAENNLLELRNNKYRIVQFAAYIYALRDWERDSQYTGYVGVGDGFFRVYINMALSNGQLAELFNELQGLQVTVGHLKTGLSKYNEVVNYYIGQLNRKDNKNGIKELIKRLRGEETVDTKKVRNQFFKLASELKGNWLVARTWGFEVEVPDAKGVSVLPSSGIEKGEDGSLRSYESNDDCECDCSECVYHDCDCEYCENQNSDPDHCGNSYCAQCDSAEFRTTGGIQRGIHSGLVKLSEDLIENEAENNDTAGVHIHVYGADLTMQQVAQVVAIYAVTQNVLSPIAGRENVNYAANISYDKIAQALDKKNPQLYNEKPLAVNLMHLNNRGTIEFRQMACNFDWREITVWAAIVRGIVNAAKRGAQFHEFKNITDLDTLMERLAKFDHTIGNEEPEELIYGSRTDKDIVAKTKFVYV